MHYDPRCFNMKHKCPKVCISESCQIVNPFICDICGNHHKEECTIIEYKQLVKKMHKKQAINKTVLLKHEDYVETTFNTLIKSLQAEFIKFRELFEHINANPKIASFYQTLKSHKENKLNARVIFDILNQQLPLKNNYRLKSQSTMWTLSQEIIELQKKLNEKLPFYYGVYQFNQHDQPICQVDLDLPEDDPRKMIELKYRHLRNHLKGSLLEHTMSVVDKLFEKDIYNVQLMFRASEHQFSAKEFHRKCDGKNNTLTIAKTQFGNLVGGYCALPWRSPKNWEYQQDPSKQTFIFSLGRELQGLKFEPFKLKFTVAMHQEYGPCFGDDLVIHDNSSTAKNCWSNFPDCYRCKGTSVPHDQKVIRAWVGVKDHFQKFNITEWEVFKISFNKSQELERSFMEEYRKI